MQNTYFRLKGSLFVPLLYILSETTNPLLLGAQCSVIFSQNWLYFIIILLGYITQLHPVWFSDPWMFFFLPALLLELCSSRANLMTRNRTNCKYPQSHLLTEPTVAFTVISHLSSQNIVVVFSIPPCEQKWSVKSSKCSLKRSAYYYAGTGKIHPR